MKQPHQKYKNIEHEFYEMDPETRTALVRLEYGKPSDILDPVPARKTPRMTAEFIEGIIGRFDDLPLRYKLRFLVTFEDMEGYTEEQLSDILSKNLLLETKNRNRAAFAHNRLALYLCLAGLSFILLVTWIESVWTEESALRNIVSYILDIAATVPFWGAMEICFIDNSERRRRLMNIRKRFSEIEFRHQPAE